MITARQFKAGQEYWYSDFYDKSYAKIKVIKITKTRAPNFWFDATITDNTNLDRKDAPYNAIGTLHSYSNSFVFTSMDELKKHVNVYKNQQIKFLEKYLK